MRGIGVEETGRRSGVGWGGVGLGVGISCQPKIVLPSSALK